MNDLVSIIVPIYKVEKYLDKSIRSLLNQTYKNIEIILVDDGSPDNCPKICDDFEKKFNNITVIHQKNMGLSGARNSGIKIAKGDFLFFHDSDDSLEPDCISELVKCIKKYNTDISICGRFYEFENGEKFCKYTERFDKIYTFEDAMEEMNKFFYFDMSAWGKLYKKHLFNDIEFPVGKLSEDYFIMYKLFEKSKNVSFISKPLYNYLQRQNSISKNKKINEDFLIAAEKQMQDLENYSEKMKIIVHVAYASACLTVMDFYIKQDVVCPKENLKKYKEIIKENYIYIKKYKNITFAKRMQFKLFSMNVFLYKIVFKIYKKKYKI